MVRVFISHSGLDNAEAAVIGKWIRDDGHEVFLDRDADAGIHLGDEWQNRLAHELQLADAFVCVVSPAYARSAWCAAELGGAAIRGNRILPVVKEQVAGIPFVASERLHRVKLDAGEDAAKSSILHELRRIAMRGGDTWPKGRSPFPGLLPFDRSRSLAFFGRAQEAKDLADHLRSPQHQVRGDLVLLVGPSGSGKSSIARAGLAPLIAADDDWVVLAPFTPGPDPVDALARELWAAGTSVGATGEHLGFSSWTERHVADELRENGLTALALELLRNHPGARRLLVVVDQLEELVTRESTALEQRFALLDILRRARVQVDGALPVHTVGTIATPYLDDLQRLLEELQNRRPEVDPQPIHPFTVEPLRREALRAIVQKPAELAGIGVDDVLVERLVEDTRGGEALPLLAYTLWQLAGGREVLTEHGPRLTVERYEKLGRVDGAVANKAAEAWSEVAALGKAAGRSVDLSALAQLASVDEYSAPVRRQVPRTALEESVGASIQPFVTHRLLTVTIEDGTDVVAVTHDALFTAWHELELELRRQIPAKRAQRDIERLAESWREDRRDDRLLERGALAAVMRDLGLEGSPSRWQPSQPLNEPAREYLESSHRREAARRSRERRRWQGVTSALTVLLLGAVTAGVTSMAQRAAAQAAQRHAVARQLMLQSSDLADQDPRTALRLGIAAADIDPGALTTSSLSSGLLASLYGGTFSGYPIASNDKGTVFATQQSDGTVHLWSAPGGAVPVRRGEPLRGISYVADGGQLYLSPMGDLLAEPTASGVRLWATREGDAAAPVSTVPTDESASTVEFSPDGRTMTIRTAGGVTTRSTSSLWDIEDPADPVALPSPTAETASLTLLQSGVLITPWRPGTPDQPQIGPLSMQFQRFGAAQPDPARIEFHGEARVAAEGDRAVTTDDGSLFVVWDVNEFTADGAWDPQVIGELRLPDGVVLEWPRLSADGTTLSGSYRGASTPSTDGEQQSLLALWDLSDPTHPRSWIAPRTGDGDAWQVASPAERWGAVETGPFSFGYVVPGEETIAGLDVSGGLLTLWDVSTGDATQIGTAIPLRVSEGAPPWVLADGSVLYRGASDSTTRLDLTGARAARPTGPGVEIRPGKDGPAGPRALAFTADGELRVLTTTGDLETWDVHEPADPVLQSSAPLAGSADEAYSSSFAPGARRALSVAGKDVRIYSLDTTEVRDVLRPLEGTAGEEFTVHNAALSPDGTILAVSGADAMVLWDVSDPKAPARITDIRDAPRYAAHLEFSPDGRVLALDADGGFLFHDVSQPAQPRLLGQVASGGMAFAYAADSTLAAVADDDRVLLVALDGQAAEIRGIPLTGHARSVRSLSFSPDGSLLVVGDEGDGITVWDVANADRPRRLGVRLAADGAGALAFAPSGMVFASGGGHGAASGRVELWDVSGARRTRPEVIADACALVGPMERAEWDRYLPSIDFRPLCRTQRQGGNS